MNQIMASVMARPIIARLLLGAVAVLVAACNNAGGKPGY
jgi:predicted small secreted protein